MDKTIIDEEVLQKIAKLSEQLENFSNIKTTTHKKRQEGSYELYNNGKARLYYMLDKTPYRTTVEAKNDEEATKQLALFVDEVKKGNFINTNYTFSEFTQIWLDEKVRPNADEHQCVRTYVNYLNNRILPYIGNIKLKKLNRKTLENYFNEIKETKTLYSNRKENKTLSAGSVKKLKSIIHACLEYAVECELIPRNPCNKIKINFTNSKDLNSIKDLVNKKRKKIQYFTVDEYKEVCETLENEFKHFYYDDTISSTKKLREIARRLLVLIDLKTGMRRSELFGLARNDEYNDLDIKNATFDVNKSRHYAKGLGKYTKYPKNDSSIRKKSLPRSLLPFIKLYFEYLDKINYKEMYIFEHLSIDGTSAWWDKWLAQHHFRDIRLHDIRHTHPTILLYLGVDLKTISERLGHADIQMTFNTYADVLKELDEQSAKKIDSL